MTLSIPQWPIIDLHCDLLAYLTEKPTHTPYDSQVRCSISQLREGGVKLQTMAIFTETMRGSQEEGEKQFACFMALPEQYPKEFTFVQNSHAMVCIMAAIENSSGFCGEEEALEIGLARLRRWHRRAGKLAYVSLTWNLENRFGGGAFTQVGLRPDGERLLEELEELGIPIDLSHASDRLAYDILNVMDKRLWKSRVLASHSNFRRVTDVPRNLPDELAGEIIRREGVIGLGLVCTFIGEEGPAHLANHVEHALSLGGENALCFGADYFYEGTIPPNFKVPGKRWFFPGYEDAAAYPKVMALFQQRLSLSPQQIEKIAYRNVSAFLAKI